MNRTNFFLIVFALASIAELLALFRSWTEVHMAAKPLIVLALIGYYLSSVQVRNNTFVRAMFFCWTGDLLLLFQGQDELYFVIGLLAFLLGHGGYIISYRQLRWEDRSGELLITQKARYAFPVILVGTGLLVVLFPGLDHLTIPVIIYAVVLMMMVITAIFRFGRTSPGSFLLVMVGAFFFMASDSLLAINKFYSAFELSAPWIMLTYSLAQFMIVEGVLLHGERN